MSQKKNRTQSRKDKLLAAVDGDTTYEPLIDDIVYLEGELDTLRRLPKIKVHPDDPEKQKPTPASKMYKEMLQQYINALKLLVRASGADEADEESPLRSWFKERGEAGSWRG